MSGAKVWNIIRIIIVIVFLGVNLHTMFHPDTRLQDAMGKRIENHAIFSGKIIEVNQSGNHAFGILKIAVSETNNNRVTDTIREALFPFRLVDKYAEVYAVLPYNCKRGNDIILTADKRYLKFYDNGKLIDSVFLSVTKERTNMGYVRRHTRFKILAEYLWGYLQ